MTPDGTNRPTGAPILPAVEIDLILNTVQKAITLAHDQRPEEGAAELARGKDRVTAALRAGKPWAAEMVQSWREALANYCFQHRVRPLARSGERTQDSTPAPTDPDDPESGR